MSKIHERINEIAPSAVGFLYMISLLIVLNYNIFYYEFCINIYSIIIMFCVYIIAINTLQYEKNDYFLFFGIACFYIGLFYTISFIASYDFAIGQKISDVQRIQLRNDYRLLESITFFVSNIFLYKSIKKELLFFIYSLASVILFMSIFSDRSYIMISSTVEYFIIAFIIIAIIMINVKKSYMDESIYRTMLAAIVILFVYNISITLFNAASYVSSTIRAFSYYFLYKALVKSALNEPQKLLFFDLKLMNQDLETKTEKLIKSRDFFLTIFDKLPDPIWRCESSGNRDFFNEAWVDFTGSLNPNIIEYIHKDDYEGYIKKFYDAFEKREKFEYEYRLKKHDGDYFWFRETAIPFYDLDKKFSGYIGSCQNMTEARNKIELLEKYKLLTDNANDIILFIDMNGNIMEANKKAEIVYGYSKEELCKMRIIDLRKNSEQRLIAEQLKKAAEKSIVFETLHAAKDGTEIPVEVSSSGIHLSQSYVILSVVRDITERRKAEILLQKSEEKYRHLFTNMQEAFVYAEVVYDNDGNPVDFILRDTNKAFLYATGSIRQNIIDRSIVESFPSALKTEPNVIDIFKEAALKRQKASAEVKFYGVHEWYYISCFSISGTHIYIMLLDITDIKYMQEELESKNEELEGVIKNLKNTQGKLIQSEKLAGIGQLSAGIAHEINNPLGFVSSNFETLKKYVNRYRAVLNEYDNLEKDKGNKTKEEIAEKLNEIEEIKDKYSIEIINEDIDDLIGDTAQGLGRIGKIVIALRTFARSEQMSDYSSYDLNEGIRTTLIIANNELKYYADVKTELSDIPEIEANGGQINQVLLNLIINSVQAIKSKTKDERGLISITTKTDDQYVKCEIQDDGVGIPQNVLNRIMEPFFTTKPVGEGTGLGLSISYDIIVEKHKGELNVESEEGRGTKITIKLPIAKHQAS